MEQNTQRSAGQPPRRPRRPAGLGSAQHSVRRPAGSGSAQHPARRPAGSGSAQHPARRPAGSGSAQYPARRPAGSGSAQHPARRPAGSGSAQHAARRPAGSGSAQHPARRPAGSGSAQQRRRPAAPARQRGIGDLLLSLLPDQKHTGSAPRTQGGRARSAAAGRRRTAPVTPQSLVLFAIVLVLYMVIGSLISGRHAKKEQAYLAEYEASRPQYTIEEYIASLDDSFFQNMLLQAAQRIPVSEYETTDGIMDTLQMKSATLDTSQPYSYTKKEDYSDSRPSYYIMRGEDAVASVALDRSGWTDGYNFPIWRVHEPESLLDVHAEPAYSIDVTMAQGCVLKVNGVTVPDDLLKDVESDFVLNNTEQYYMTQPMAKHCVLSGLYMPPTVEVTDEAGNPVTPDSAPDPQAAVQEYHFPYPPDANPDPALVEFADKATRAYMDYVINKNKDRYNNIAVLNNYLMPGSEAAILMQEIINDIYWNNEYDTREDQVEVQAVRTYSEKLCTVDVHFDTVLTKAEAGTRNEYISTIRWTLVNNGWGWRATSFELFS